MTETLEFYIGIIITVVVSFITFKAMMDSQKHKEEVAERKFREALKLIEMRNRIKKDRG
jgi:mannitol-specific phosphotransferase system IIBC component